MIVMCYLFWNCWQVRFLRLPPHTLEGIADTFDYCPEHESKALLLETADT